MLKRVRTAERIKDRRVRIAFSNGKVGEVNLRPLLRGPVFRRIRTSDAAFRRLQVDKELGTIVWPNRAGLCPDVLYRAVVGKNLPA